MHWIPRPSIYACHCFPGPNSASTKPGRTILQGLKQNLKVKSFVGTTENARRIQIWTALIAILLLKWLHHLSKAKWSLSNPALMLRLN